MDRAFDKMLVWSIIFTAMVAGVALLKADRRPEPQSKIELVSPDGKSSILIQASNEGAEIWMLNGKTGEDVAIYTLYYQGTAIGMRKDRREKEKSFNLALAIEKGTVCLGFKCGKAISSRRLLSME